MSNRRYSEDILAVINKYSEYNKDANKYITLYEYLGIYALISIEAIETTKKTLIEMPIIKLEVPKTLFLSLIIILFTGAIMRATAKTQRGQLLWKIAIKEDENSDLGKEIALMRTGHLLTVTAVSRHLFNSTKNRRISVFVELIFRLTSHIIVFIFPIIVLFILNWKLSLLESTDHTSFVLKYTSILLSFGALISLITWCFESIRYSLKSIINVYFSKDKPQYKLVLWLNKTFHLNCEFNKHPESNS